jgi:hypothetical protein
LTIKRLEARIPNMAEIYSPHPAAVEQRYLQDVRAQLLTSIAWDKGKVCLEEAL